MATNTITKEEKAKKTDSPLMAVIKTGGKQYIVKVGDVLKIEKINESEIKDGKITFSDVLMIDDGKNTKVGTPILTGSKVIANIVTDEIKEKKVIVIKYKPKSRYFKKNGHRQIKTVVKIAEIK